LCEHFEMRRSTALVLVVLGAALAGLVFSSSAIRLDGDATPAEESVAAGPQTAMLFWRETFGPPGQKLVFEVQRFQVLRDGWKAWVGLKNETDVAYEVGDPRATIDRSFGLMLFETGRTSELDSRNTENALPTLRPATRYKPELPKILESKGTWHGVISAPGSLVAGSWMRVVFGTLTAVGSTGDVLEDRVVWITDHAYRLRQ
jgi:hypothetical protein